jgi:hypothetical protein
MDAKSIVEDVIKLDTERRAAVKWQWKRTKTLTTFLSMVWYELVKHPKSNEPVW